MIINETCKVISNLQIAQNIYEAHLQSRDIAQQAEPGQFINILPRSNFPRTMRRPMSISHQDKDSLKIIYKPIGIGTELMKSWKVGDDVDVIGPLGNSWDYSHDKDYVLIGGGVGLAPIMNLYEKIKKRKNVYLFLGAQDEKEHFLEHSPKDNIYISTDNGTKGIKGNLFDALKRILTIKNLQNKVMYVCGPPKMMEALKFFSNDNNIECYLALETIMACGFGICQGCTVEMCNNVNITDSYRQKYGLVCIDGPIFKSNEVKTCLL